MKKRTYQTITGRTLGLGELHAKERAFLAAVRRTYGKGPEWSEFAAWWIAELRRSGLSIESVTYRICQDLEARLGIAQGKVGPPDYRDYLADLIEERYGSRYRFCKESGVDPGHLSRVLASRSELSLQSLQRILDALHAALVIQPEEDLAERVSPERAAEALAAAAR
jgi:transcriptional regulator with XRE-family HTH domain